MSVRRAGSSRRTRTALAVAAAGGAAVLGLTVLPATAQATTAGPHATARTHARPEVAETRAQEIQRAATWLTANNGGPVPYSQSRTWSDGYRQDCSGYVSMALGLGKPGPNTVGLASDRDLTTPINLADLRTGDLLIDADGTNNTRHVVIFEKWTDSSHSAYTAYEQRGGHGTDHRNLTYGLASGSEYKPYRPVNVTD